MQSQTHTVGAGDALVIDGVTLTVLAVIGGDILFGVGDPEPAAEGSPSPQLCLPLESWLSPSPN